MRVSSVTVFGVSGADGKRMQLYPEGGLVTESYVHGPGWVLDTEAITEAETVELLEQLQAMVASLLERLVSHA